MSDGWKPWPFPLADEVGEWLAQAFTEAGCPSYRSFGEIPAADARAREVGRKLQRALDQLAREFVAAHEWRWVAGRCEVRGKT